MQTQIQISKIWRFSPTLNPSASDDEQWNNLKTCSQKLKDSSGVNLLSPDNSIKGTVQGLLRLIVHTMYPVCILQSSKIETFHPEYLLFATTVEEFQNSEYRGHVCNRTLTKEPTKSESKQAVWCVVEDFLSSKKFCPMFKVILWQFNCKIHSLVVWALPLELP